MSWVRILSKVFLGAGFGLSAWDLLQSAREGTNGGVLGDVAFAKRLPPLRDVPVSVEKQVWNIERRVELIKGLAIGTPPKGTPGTSGYKPGTGHRSERINEITKQILARKVSDGRGGLKWAVPEKDCRAEVVAIYNAIRNPSRDTAVRYTRDMLLADTFSDADRTLLVTHGADCFVHGTQVLRDDHRLVPVETLKVGDRIWGLDRWSTITNTWPKGILPTWRVGLNNGSFMRLTPDHKVWTAICPRHDGRLDGGKTSPCSCPVKDREVGRIRVAELKKGMVVLQPDRIPFGREKTDPDRAWMEGTYLADGWLKRSAPHLPPSGFCIAGKDGHPKEEQKRRVERICARLGIPTKWHSRYITVKDRAWAARLATMGDHAPLKHAVGIDLDEGAALPLLEGIMADSGRNRDGSRTLTTTSHELFLQALVLHKMAGVTCSVRFVADHGGLGTHPVWRLSTRRAGERPEGMKSAKLLRVKSIERDGLALPCFDLETDDHFVWLPEVDWTTSQCDDYSSLIASMLMTVGHVVAARTIQAKGKRDWSHIYLLTPERFDDPTSPWMSVDASVAGKEAGWQVAGAAEVARYMRAHGGRAPPEAIGLVMKVRDFPFLPGAQGKPTILPA